jgi:hypothetical protein
MIKSIFLEFFKFRFAGIDLSKAFFEFVLEKRTLLEKSWPQEDSNNLVRILFSYE